MSQFALIDADIIMHVAYGRACSFLSKNSSVKEEIDESYLVNLASKLFNQIMLEWIHKTNLSDSILVCSGGKTFRKDLWSRYKSHRPPKPVSYLRFFDYIKMKYSFISSKRLEADDVLGILSTDPAYAGSMIVSTDKDMLTLPTSVLNPYSTNGINVLDISTADYNWRYQTLVGDQADGYPGLPKVGPKKATKILREEDSWESVFKAYSKAGWTKEDAILQARLARILRYEDFKENPERIRLWNYVDAEEWLVL